MVLLFKQWYCFSKIPAIPDLDSQAGTFGALVNKVPPREEQKVRTHWQTAGPESPNPSPCNTAQMLRPTATRRAPLCWAPGNLQGGLSSCRTVSHSTLQLQQVSLDLPTVSQLALSENCKKCRLAFVGTRRNIQNAADFLFCTLFLTNRFLRRALTIP